MSHYLLVGKSAAGTGCAAPGKVTLRLREPLFLDAVRAGVCPAWVLGPSWPRGGHNAGEKSPRVWGANRWLMVNMGRRVTAL